MATIQGTVKDALGNFARRLVRLHRKYDGALAGEALSNPSTGEFSISTSDQTKHYAVVHDQDSWLTYLPFDGANNDTVFFEWGGKPITANGSAKISTTESKFGGSAAYFDGSGDYLTTPSNPELAFGTLDFTIEAWVRLDAIGTERAIFDSRAVSTDTGLYLGVNTSGYLTAYGNNATILTATGTAIAATTWAHVALVKSAGTMTLYLNGVSVGSAASSYTITAPGSVVIGRKLGSTTNDFNGYMDDMRIQNGKAQYVANFNVPTVPHMTVQDGDPYWNNVVLGCHFDGQPDNGDAHRNSVVLNMRGNTLTEDTGKTVTAYGNAAVATVSGRSAFGGKAIAFDGSGDYLTADNAAFAFGTGDFTIEAFVFLGSTNQLHIDTRTVNASTTGFSCNISTASIGFYQSAGSNYTYAVSLNNSQWYHVCWQRQSGSFKAFIDGVQVGVTQTVSANMTNAYLTIGANINNRSNVSPLPAYWFNGFIDDLRITKGVARYTADFTPPTAELPALQHALPDVASGKILTANGDVKISATQSKFGGYSAYFDGTGDYISISPTSDFVFGSTPYTIEFFLWQSAAVSGDILSFTASNQASFGQYDLGVSSSRQVYLSVRPTTGGTFANLTSTNLITLSAWNHIAFVFNGTTTTVFINGVASGSATLGSFNVPSPYAALGVRANLYSPVYFNGYIDDLRITKGVARYTVDFTIPTSAFPEQLLTFGQKNALIYDHLTPV